MLPCQVSREIKEGVGSAFATARDDCGEHQHGPDEHGSVGLFAEPQEGAGDPEHRRQRQVESGGRSPQATQPDRFARYSVRRRRRESCNSLAATTSPTQAPSPVPRLR